jgi:LacI family transcriptional regulator
MGLVVPDFVSVIGFDDMALSHCVRPTLTTVRQPIQEMGERSLHLLWQMIEEDVSPGKAAHIQLEPELAIRASCGSPR